MVALTIRFTKLRDRGPSDKNTTPGWIQESDVWLSACIPSTLMSRVAHASITVPTMAEQRTK